MSDTYCHTSSVSLRSAALQFSLENRLALRLNTVGSMIYIQKWKRITTPSGRSLLAHTASARRTSGKDCTGWQTPSVTVINERSEESMEKRTAARLATGRTSLSPGNLAEQVQMYAGYMTPKASDGQFSTPRTSGRPMEKSTHLQTQVVALMSNHPSCKLPELSGWATPRVTTNNGIGSEKRAMDHKSRLEDQVFLGSTAETTNTGQLNPGLSRWLQQFPVEWCIAAIRSTRKKPVP